MDNFEYISRLLSAAFLLFATGLFLAIGIQYILRHDDPSQTPSRRRAKICVLHTTVIIGLLIGGFILLDLVLISIGQKAIGIVGITLLGIIPVWYFGISVIEAESGSLGADGMPQETVSHNGQSERLDPNLQVSKL